MVTAIPASYTVPCTTCPTAIPGQIAGGYAFDGTVLVRLLHPELIRTAPYSATVWVRLSPASPDNLQALFAKASTMPSVLNVSSLTVFANTGDIVWESSEGGMLRSIGAGQDLRGAWHHIVTSWDGTTRRLFVDGGLAASNQIVITDSMLDVSLGADLDDGIPRNRRIPSGCRALTRPYQAQTG